MNLQPNPHSDFEYNVIVVINLVLIMFISIECANYIIPRPDYKTEPIGMIVWSLFYITIFLTIIAIIERLAPEMPINIKVKQ